MPRGGDRCHGRNRAPRLYQRTGADWRNSLDYRRNDSIGILYSLVTLHLGFDFNADEYKIMGLAPYGDPARFRAFFEEAVELRDDGSVRIPILRTEPYARRARELSGDPGAIWTRSDPRQRRPGERYSTCTQM